MNKPACPKHETGGGPCYCPPAPAARTVAGCQRIDGGADCHSYGTCVGCHNAIYEEVAFAPACESHHMACNCREHGVAVLIKAALDAAVQLDETKHCVVGVSKSPDEDQRRQEKSSQIVERVYAACEALGADISAHEVAA